MVCALAEGTGLHWLAQDEELFTVALGRIYVYHRVQV